MRNPNINDLAQNVDRYPIKLIIKRLITEINSIFLGDYDDTDYQNLVAVFARLNQVRLTEENAESLRDFIDGGIIMIARRYNNGGEIHPGTMNILIMAIQLFNRAHGEPYHFDKFIENITPETAEFMVEIVQPITQNLLPFALHHAPWVNPVFVAHEAARRAREEAPGAETHIARTLAKFRAMGGPMEAACPVCMEEFIEIERPEDPKKSKGMRRSPLFMPVVFHKDAKGKWLHPMHTACINNLKKEECPMCREKVIWPEMKATRKTGRPNSSPTRRRSSPGRRSSHGLTVKRSRRRSVNRRSADF
ncbi:MAG: hypothetical protein EBU84_00915 [Actinobacteria bacterium]|nr:hypothetical protein [Actinomycetota bacterium]